MRKTLLLCAGMMAVGQNAMAAGVANLPKPSQISSDCEQTLAAWFIATYGAFAEPGWRALSETAAFGVLFGTIKHMEALGCPEQGHAIAGCSDLAVQLQNQSTHVREQAQYSTYAASEAFRAVQTALRAVQEGECLSKQEVFYMEHSLVP